MALPINVEFPDSRAFMSAEANDKETTKELPKKIMKNFLTSQD